MNLSTLRALAKNPHYKMSEKQRQELRRLEEEENHVYPMVEFGKPPIHNSNIGKHPTEMPRKAK